MRMKSIILGALAGASVFAALPAAAAVTLVSADVRGPTGTVWDTTQNGFYTLFLQQPFGNALNPNDEALNASVTTGDTDFVVAGDGWPLNTRTGNSDPFYTLTLSLTDGASTQTLSGVFNVAAFNLGQAAFTAAPGTAIFGDTAYALTDFFYVRNQSNIVGAYSVASKGNANTVPVGSLADYQGAFTLTASAVPEPATWAMMMVGFGVVGASMRRRPSRTLQAA